MNEMIERVAKAIYAIEGLRPAWGSEMCSPGATAHARKAAAAAIEAMREPTEAMLHSAMAAPYKEGRVQVVPLAMYLAMIDAALTP